MPSLGWRRWELSARRFAVGCGFLRAQGPGARIACIEGLSALEAHADRVFAHHLSRPGVARARGSEADGWVIVRHPETSAVQRMLQDLASDLRIVASEDAPG